MEYIDEDNDYDNLFYKNREFYYNITDWLDEDPVYDIYFITKCGEVVKIDDNNYFAENITKIFLADTFEDKNHYRHVR